MSSEGESVVTRQEAASSSYKPPPVHVPPRIDPDLYQAEIPDFKPDAEAEKIALAQSARCVYSENSSDSEAVDEFLVLVRNLMDKLKPTGSSAPEIEGIALNSNTIGTVDSNGKGNDSTHNGDAVAHPHSGGFALWQKHHSNFPLQSDAATLEYLSNFEYDVEKAWFHLCCMLGCGKDAVLTRKAMTSIERQANATVFQDNKERFFNKDLASTTYSIVGAYGKHGRVVGRNTVNVDRHPLEPAGEEQQEEEVMAGGELTSAALYPPRAAVSAKSSRSNLDTLTVKSEGGATGTGGSVIDGGSGGLFSPDEMDCIDAVGVLAGSPPTSSAGAGAGAGGSRAARNNNSSLDKAELKKQWLSITRKVQGVLNAGSKKTSNGSTSGRCNIREAHRLLDKASLLPPYNTVTMSSHTTTPEEEDVLNASKLVLGELLKAVLTTRDWISEVRDTLYNCNLNLIIRVDRESRQVTNVTELKSLLTEGCNLQIVSPTEETQLRDLIANVENISKDMRRIILVHLAANKNKTTSVPEGIEKWGLGAGRITARPEALYVSEEDRRKYHYGLALAENHLKNALDYESSSTVNAAFSNGTSAGSSEELAEGRIITLAELTALMARVKQLPIIINESIFMQHILDEALDYSHALQAFIAKNRMLKFTKSKTILEHAKPDLVALLNLRDTIEHTCVVQIPEFTEFVEVLNASLSWQKEVWGLNNETPPPLALLYQPISAVSDSAAAAGLPATGTSARAKAKAAAAAGSGSNSSHNKPVPLKKVEFLLSEGEKLPFNFPAEMEILKEKKQQAKLWLEKLKKSFVPSKAGSNRLRKGQEDGDEGGAGSGSGGPEKLKLSDMKMMVSEGEQLFNLENGESSGGKTVNRELDRALNVVETAEDWVSRVRELLLSDYSEAKSTDQDAKDIEEEDGEKGSEEGESDEESEPGRPPTVASMIRFLHNLLQEADQMPVVMEEATVLRAHLQALEWSVKVKPFLPVVSPVASVTNDVEGEGVTTTAASLEEVEDHKKSKPKPVASNASALARRKNPRLSEIQTFAREITKIRGSLSEALRAEFPTKALVEETQCLELVADAEKWLARVKRVVLQGNVIKKGTPLSKLRDLFTEGQAIPINFNNELKPIRSAISAAEDWLENHYSLLVRLGLYQEVSRDRTIPREGTKKGSAENEDEEGGENDEAQPMETDAAEATSAVDDSKNEEEEEQEMSTAVTLKDLVDLVQSSGNLIAEFPSAIALAEKLEEVTSWINSVKNITSKGVSPRESQRKKKKTAAFEEASNAASAEDSAAASESATPGKPGKLITIEELDTLIDDGLAFGLDLSEEVSSLQQVKTSALTWQKKTEEYFAEEFVKDIGAISKSYVQLHAQVKRMPALHTLSFSFLLMTEKLATEDAAGKKIGTAAGTANGDKKTIGTSAAPVTASVPLNDREVHEMIVTVLSNINALESEGVTIGIDLPVTSVLKLYSSILSWVVDARNLLCGNTVSSVNSYADSTRNTQSSSANTFLTKLAHWGDCTQAYVSTLLQEAEHILEALGSGTSEDAVDWNKSVLSAEVLQSQQEFNEKLTSFYAEKFEDKKSAEAEAEGDAPAIVTESSAVDSGAVATTATSSSGNTGKRGSRSAGGSRKRDRHSADLEASAAAAAAEVEEAVSDSEEAAAAPRRKEVKVEAKATRGSQGIVKKKVDTAYDEKAAAAAASGVAASPAAAAHISEAVEVPVKEITTSSNSRSKKRKLDATAESGAAGAIEGETAGTSSAVYVRSTEYLKLLDAIKQSGEGSSEHKLPTALVTLMQVWRRCLTLFSLRLAEVHRWHQEISALVRSHTNAAGVVTRYYGEQAEQYIAIATERQLHCSSRAEIEERIQGSKTWLATATVLANGSGGKKMSMDDLKAFIKLSDSVIFPHDEVLDELKNALKAAKNWKVKFDRSGYDPNTGAGASSEIVTELIAESKTINVDLSEFTENLNQFTKTYCLCRQLYFGEMVGCDTCEEWYHFSCIGVNSNIASKNDSYVCIRCALLNSFNYSCELVANMTNKWMQCSEHFKLRESQLQRVEKKIQRDENLVAKLSNTLRSTIQDCTRVAAQQAAAAEIANSPSILAPVGDKPVPVSVPMIENTKEAMRAAYEVLPISYKASLSALFRELEEGEVTLQKSRSEYSALKVTFKEEASKIQFIIQWMMMLQKILWPQSEIQKGLGAPLGSDASIAYQQSKGATVAAAAAASAATVKSEATEEKGDSTADAADSEMQVDNEKEDALHDAEEDDTKKKAEAASASIPSAPAVKKDPVEELTDRRAFLIKSLSNNLLPDGLITLAHSAISMSIHNVEDVLLAVDAFRWMSWCNICVQLLRCPPTTYELRKLVDVTKNLRLTDEKSIKLLTNILTKACTWKSKARKLILQSMKNKLDESKLTQCVLEGNSLPFSSRLKDILKGMMTKKPSDGSASSSSSSGAAASSSGTDLGTRKSIKPLGGTYGGFASGKVGAVPREIPDSSDEERTFIAKQSRDASAIASGAAPASVFKQGCTFDPTTLADPSLIKWPVPLSTGQKALNVEITTQMMKMHGTQKSDSANSGSASSGEAKKDAVDTAAEGEMEEGDDEEEEEGEEEEEKEQEQETKTESEAVEKKEKPAK